MKKTSALMIKKNICIDDAKYLRLIVFACNAAAQSTPFTSPAEESGRPLDLGRANLPDSTPARAANPRKMRSVSVVAW